MPQPPERFFLKEAGCPLRYGVSMHPQASRVHKVDMHRSYVRVSFDDSGNPSSYNFHLFWLCRKQNQKSGYVLWRTSPVGASKCATCSKPLGELLRAREFGQMRLRRRS